MMILTKDEVWRIMQESANGDIDYADAMDTLNSHEALREQAERRLEMMGWLCRQWTRNVGWEVHPNDEEYYAQIRTELEATG